METKEEVLLSDLKTARAELRDWEKEVSKDPSDFNTGKVVEFNSIVKGLEDDLESFNNPKEVNPIEEFFNHLKTQIKEPKKIYIARVILTEKYALDDNKPEEVTLDIKAESLLEVATLKETLEMSLKKTVIIDDVTELEVK